MTHFSVCLALVGVLQLSGCKDDPPVRPAPGPAEGDTAKPPDVSSKSVGFKAIVASAQAFNRRSWEVAAAIYAAEARWTTSAGPSEPAPAPVVGRRAALSIWKDLASWFPDLELVVTRMVKLPRGFLVESWIGGTTSKAVEPLGFKPGVIVGARAAELLTVEKGRVAKVESWGGISQVRAQLSGAAEAEARPPVSDPAPEVAGTMPPDAVAAAIKALGVEGAEWSAGAGNVVVAAKGATLWVLTLDGAGAVASKRRYGAAE